MKITKNYQWFREIVQELDEAIRTNILPFAEEITEEELLEQYFWNTQFNETPDTRKVYELRNNPEKIQELASSIQWDEEDELNKELLPQEILKQGLEILSWIKINAMLGRKEKKLVA
jgi:hypothetical protein